MMEHSLVAGRLPEDGHAIEARLDAASKQGFTLHSTKIASIPATPGGFSVYYVATLVRVKEVEKPGGIRMTGGPRG